MKEIEYMKHNQHIFETDFIEKIEEMLSYEDDTLITHRILEEYGFICERKRMENSDLDGIWYNEFNLCEDHYSGEFNFAVYVRGTGCMKSGYGIETLGRLKELFKGITGRKLEKVEIIIPNKL